MRQSRCANCDGEGWVCENHPKVPWRDGDGCCGGAGAPCTCHLLFGRQDMNYHRGSFYTIGSFSDIWRVFRGKFWFPEMWIRIGRINFYRVITHNGMSMHLKVHKKVK